MKQYRGSQNRFETNFAWTTVLQAKSTNKWYPFCFLNNALFYQPISFSLASVFLRELRKIQPPISLQNEKEGGPTTRTNCMFLTFAATSVFRTLSKIHPWWSYFTKIALSQIFDRVLNMPLTTFCSQIMTKKHNFSRELISTACQWYDFITSDLEQGNGKKKEEKKKLKKCGTLNYLFNIQLENVVWKYKTL